MLINKMKKALIRILNMEYKLQRIQEALGRIENRQIQYNSGCSLNDSEFRVFSQWGEDGIIQNLIRNIPIEKKIFVEFGVENYTESNTRFLLINNNWSGLVIDGSEEHIEYIKRDKIYWMYNLKAICSFITKENINELLEKNGITGDIGILSIDIDGNDYWVWNAIDFTKLRPRIIICEYNSLFGYKARITTPYKKDFVRGTAHYSKIFYGASIAALVFLAKKKGYSLVGSNSAGNNVFFVRNDLVGDIPVLNEKEAYIQAEFREHHDENGDLTYYNFEERLESIRELEVYNLDIKGLCKVKDIF